MELNTNQFKSIINAINDEDFNTLTKEVSPLINLKDLKFADIVLIDGIFTKKIISFTSIESVVLIKYIHIPKYLSPKDINYFYTKQKALNLVQTRNFFLSNSNYEQLIEICIESNEAELVSDFISSKKDVFYIFFEYIFLFLNNRTNSNIGIDVKLSNFILTENKISNIDFIPPILKTKNFNVKNALKILFENQKTDILKKERPEYLDFGFFNSKGILYRTIFTLLYHRYELVFELEDKVFQNKVCQIDKRFYSILLLSLNQETLTTLTMDSFEYRIFTNLSYIINLCRSGKNLEQIKNLDIHFNINDTILNYAN